MRILLTNDDGVSFYGIHALVNAFYLEHEVIVVAPAEERSGFSHSVTIFSPFSYSGAGSKIPVKNIEAYAVNGTPADCVKLAILHLLKDRLPDLIISGINSGPNLGQDIMYSGTVGAASEGVLLGIPSIAISLGDWTKQENAYVNAANFLKKNIDTLFKLAQEGRGKIVLNVNCPKQNYKGVKFAKSSSSIYSDYYDFCSQDNGNITMKLKGDIIDKSGNNHVCDLSFVKRGYVSITPLNIDRTNHELIEKYNKEIVLNID